MNDLFDHKLEIFIGATRRDLGLARKKIIDAILDIGHIPSGMELWASGVEPLLDDISRHLERCDAHIIVLGARYGEYISDRKISFTEWEYEQSCGKRPILAFVLNDEEFKKAREQQKLKDEKERNKENDIIRFREKLLHSRFCRSFSNTRKGIEELGRLCANAIHELINVGKVDKNAGWIRASSPEALTLQDIRANPFLERQLNRLREFNVVGKRMLLDRSSKQCQAEVFWKRMMGPIRRFQYYNLFFESGSTLAYVSDKFESFVLKNSADSREWHVWTNNVLTLFQLLLYTDVDIRRFPASSPDPIDKYGAIFPREWHKLHEDPPLEPRTLYIEEANAVEKMRQELLEFGEKTLFLATTSCWDLDHSSQHFQGPHVGSHPNMLFKRAIFTTGQPVAIFLNAEKFGDPFISGKCYPVFGPDLALEKVLTEFPLALCVGFDQGTSSATKEGLDPIKRKTLNNPERIIQALTRLNFKKMYTGPISGDIGAIIAGNQYFSDFLP